jgi:hypothetical protein
MLLLTSVSDIVRVTTGSAAALDVHESHMDNASGVITPGRTNTASISTATTTTVVGSPGSSVQRNVKLLDINNTHATVSTTVLVEHFDGTTAESLWNGTLLPGESVIFDELGVWTKYSAAGLVETLGLPLTTKGDLIGFDTGPDRIPVGADGTSLMAAASAALGVKYALATLSNRSVSTVSAGFAADTYLAGSAIALGAGGPVVGTKYRLIFDMVKTAAGTAAFVVTVRYGTAGTTADTAILTFTFGAGTAVADTGKFELELHFRTVGSGTSAVVVGNLKLLSFLAVTGLASTPVNVGGIRLITTVSSGFNSTPAGSILGVSVNGGTSFSGTNTIVAAECINASI